MADEQPPEDMSVPGATATLHLKASAGMVVAATLQATGDVSSAPLDTTSLGIPVTRTVAIKQGQVTEGFHHFELIEDGNVLWSGMGNDPVEGFLQIVLHLTEGEDPNHPNG